MLAAEGDDVLVADIVIAAPGDEGAGRFAPLLVGAGDHRRFHDGRVFVEGVFHFDGGDVLATGDDDVLQTVLDLHVAVGVADSKVAGVEPAAGKGLGSRLRIFQVALHHGVAAHEDLANGLAVLRHRLEGVRVGYHDAFECGVAHALVGLEFCPLFQRQLIPLAVPGTDRHRAIDLGQAVGVGDLDTHVLDCADDLGRRRGTGNHGLDRVIDGGLGRIRHAGQGVQHNGGAAQVGDAVFVDQVQDLLRVDPAQEDVHTGHRGDGPGVAPAVAVEHR